MLFWWNKNLYLSTFLLLFPPVHFIDMTFPPKTDPDIMLVFQYNQTDKKGSKDMRSSKFTEGQIAFALKQAETGTPVNEAICI